MGRRNIKTQDPLHNLLKQIKRDYKKERGKEPSLNDVIEAGLYNQEKEELFKKLDELEEEKRRGRKGREKRSIFDEYFSL